MDPSQWTVILALAGAGAIAYYIYVYKLPSKESGQDPNTNGGQSPPRPGDTGYVPNAHGTALDTAFAGNNAVLVPVNTNKSNAVPVHIPDDSPIANKVFNPDGSKSGTVIPGATYTFTIPLVDQSKLAANPPQTGGGFFSKFGTMSNQRPSAYTTTVTFADKL